MLHIECTSYIVRSRNATKQHILKYWSELHKYLLHIECTSYIVRSRSATEEHILKYWSELHKINICYILSVHHIL